jgi:putative signal transducing protein
MQNVQTKFLKRFTSITEAELVKNLLKAYGIESILRKNIHPSLDGMPAGMGDASGADLFVLEKDLSEAKNILSTE